MSPTPTNAAPYSTAHLGADRSHLTRAFDVDPGLASGRTDPESGELVAPVDLEARRRAILEGYGHRCGRCARPVVVRSPEAGETLGFPFSVGRVRGTAEPWALEALVAVCEPCLDVLAPGGPEAVGTVATRFREAAQFPTWCCDPRVAVERAPLSGRELFRRERLAVAVPDRFDFGCNDAVAEHAALALSTPASRAVAFGEALLAARTGPPDLAAVAPEHEWTGLDVATRRRYERRALPARRIAAGDRPWLSREEVAIDGETSDAVEGEEAGTGNAGDARNTENSEDAEDASAPSP